MAHRIFTTSFASVYPHYVAKVERKGRTTAELNDVIEWLTGYDEATLHEHLTAGTTFEEFFGGVAPGDDFASTLSEARDISKKAESNMVTLGSE